MGRRWHFLTALGLDGEADERAIRRAYARRLKQIDPAADPGGFQALREAYETALDWVRERAHEENEAPQPVEQRPGANQTGWGTPYTVQFNFPQAEHAPPLPVRQPSVPIDEPVEEPAVPVPQPAPAPGSMPVGEPVVPVPRPVPPAPGPVPVGEPVVPVARPAPPAPPPVVPVGEPVVRRPADPAARRAELAAQQQKARAAAERALARVWERFQAGVAKLTAARRLGSADAWEAELHARLADEELINIDARSHFEWCIVQLLGNGWRPGHEALFPAAIKVFGWTAERGGLPRFGQLGGFLNQAVDEYQLFFSQDIALRTAQQRAAMLLRREKQVDKLDIQNNMRELQAMQARFPALLFLVTNAENVAHWEAVFEQYGHADPEAAARKESRTRRWVYGVLALLALLVFSFSDTGSGRRPRDPGRPARVVVEPDIVPTPEMMRKHVPKIVYKPGSDARPGEYTVVYQILLDVDRSILAVNLQKPSSDPGWDQAVGKALRAAKPFPANTTPVFSMRYTTRLVMKKVKQPKRRPPPDSGAAVLAPFEENKPVSFPVDAAGTDEQAQ